jgi:hypothetical protein
MPTISDQERRKRRESARAAAESFISLAPIGGAAVEETRRRAEREGRPEDPEPPATNTEEAGNGDAG